MSVVNKLRRRVEDAVERWTDYIAGGNCKSYDEYIKSCSTLRSYRGFLVDIEEARAEEMTEGSDHDKPA